MKIGILLITYKRTEFLKSILEKIEELSFPTIFYQNLALGDHTDHFEVKNLLYKFVNKEKKNNYLNPPKALNAKDSILFAINHASQLFEYVLIIEDDICIKNLSRKLIFESVGFFESNVASISFYSPYIPRSNFIKNGQILLKSFYGHSWGWLLNSMIWKDFKSEKKYKFFKNFHSINSSFRELAYYSLASLARKRIIDTWDYQWNTYCQQREFFHYKFVPSITNHLGNKDQYATNSKNSLQNDSLTIDLSYFEKHEVKNKYHIFSYRKYDSDLLIYHHKLTIFRSFLIITINFLPPYLVLRMITIYRKIKNFVNGNNL